MGVWGVGVSETNNATENKRGFLFLIFFYSNDTTCIEKIVEDRK